MSYAAIGSPLRDPSSPHHAAAAEAAATMRKLENAAAKITNTAPKTDVIDLSKPPTQEQAERLRNFGILGYGSFSAKKTEATTDLSNHVSVTHFTVDYQSEYFDLVHETTVRTSSTGTGLFTSGGSAFESTTTQLTCSWDNSSWSQSTLHESGFSLSMSGQSSWYIPAHQNEDGSISLAQFGPRPTTTVNGYRSVLTTTRFDGGQMQFSRYATAAYKAVTVLPSQERPAGAVDYRNENFSQETIKEMLRRLDQFTQAFPGFHTQA